MDELLATLRVLAVDDVLIAAFVACHDIDCVPLEHVVIHLVRTLSQHRRTMIYQNGVLHEEFAKLVSRHIELKASLLAGPIVSLCEPRSMEPSRN